MKMTTALVAGTLALSALWLIQSPIEHASASSGDIPDISLYAFGQLDRNADGKLSFLEARQVKSLHTEFYRMDLDLDGFLSPQELRSLRV
jgi:hypothetical protein